MAVNLRQVAFRGRNDDGSETTATWIDALNTDFTHDVDVTFRIRFLIDEIGGTQEKDHKPQLQYNHNGAGWVDANAASPSVIDPSVLSSFYADDDDTTQQLGSGTFISPNEAMHEGVDLHGGKLMDMNSNECEVEWAISIILADVADGDTIQLRHARKGGSPYDTYVNVPTITVNVPTKLDQWAYRWRNDDGTESSATWREAQSDQGLAPLDTTLRLRFGVRGTQGPDESLVPRVYVRQNSGSFAEIGQQGSANAVRLVNSSNVANNDTTTEQFAGADTFTAGRIIESRPPDILTATNIGNNDESEFEVVLEFSSANGAAKGDRFEFQIRRGDGTAFVSYSAIAAIRIQEAFAVISVQKKTISWNTEQEQTVTIDSVDTAKTLVLFSVETGPDPSTAQPENALFRVDLQNSTTIRARRGNTSPAFVCTMEVYIITADGIRVDRGISSAITVLLTFSQRGDVNRSIPLHSWLVTEASWSNTDYGLSDLGLVNGDVQQILWESIGLPSGFSQAWQVIHLLDPDHSLQAGDITINDPATSGTLALSPSVVTNKSIVLASNKSLSSAAAQPDEILTSTNLSSTQVTATRSGALGAGDIEVRAYVWEFGANDQIEVQRALVTIAASSSGQNATLSPEVNPDIHTPVNHHFAQVRTDATGAVDGGDTWMLRRQITATNTYRIERAETNASFFVEEYYQVVKWRQSVHPVADDETILGRVFGGLIAR